MSRVLTVLIALIVVGCAHGRTEYFPQPSNPADSAEVYVLRNRAFLESARSVKIFLDGWVIAHIRVGEYVRFSVGAGTHSVGTNQSSAAFGFEPSEVYYFLISPDGWAPGSNFEIERLEEARALPLISTYQELR